MQDMLLLTSLGLNISMLVRYMHCLGLSLSIAVQGLQTVGMHGWHACIVSHSRHHLHGRHADLCVSASARST